MNIKGLPALDAKSLGIATDELNAALQTIGLPAMSRRIAEAVARRTIRNYLLALPTVRRTGHYNQDTIAISKLAVGETHYAKATSSWGGRFMTARKLADNPQMRWRVLLSPDDKLTQIITRLNDGESANLKLGNSNPKACFLAEIGIYQSKLLPYWWPKQSSTGYQQIADNQKLMARRILNKPYAEWTTQRTNKGVKVTRTK